LSRPQEDNYFRRINDYHLSVIEGARHENDSGKG